MLLLLAPTFCISKDKIWIDTDIALGKYGRDVDDGLALMMALRSENLQIEGISLVLGGDYGYKITQRILGWYGMQNKIPIYKGVNSLQEPFSSNNEAVEALARALRKNKLTIIALGPATNISLLLQKYPELAGQIIEIVWCAGRQPGLRFAPGRGLINVCDCNFDKDPDAGQIILSSHVKLILTGYEPASDIYITLDDIQFLKLSKNPEDNWLYEQLSDWVSLWRVGLGSTKGFIPFDVITIGSFIAREYMKFYKDIPALIVNEKNDSRFWSMKRNKPYLLVSKNFNTNQKVDYYYQTNSSFKNIIIQALTPVHNSSFLPDIVLKKNF